MMPNKLLRAILIFAFIFVSMGKIAAYADTTPPITTLTVDPASPDGLNDWYVTPVNFTFEASDLESGVQSINYRLNGGSWQTVNFGNTLNLAPNPSFEDGDSGSSSKLAEWDATTLDGQTFYLQDTVNYAPGFASSSAKITTTGSGWHGINHKNKPALAAPFSNMSASVWIKTQNVTGSGFYKVYSVSDDISGNPVYNLISQSSSISGTTDWTRVDLDFVVSDSEAYGIYLDLGLEGSGSVLFDAVTLNNSSFSATAYYTVGADRDGHVLEYYSIDRAANTEVFNCATGTNCFTFKLDQTPPGNWRDAVAIRNLNSDHEIKVYVTLDDVTSGLSTNSNKYKYHTSVEPGFGYFEDLIKCNSTWYPDQYRLLEDYPTTDGILTYTLVTPITDVCDSNWKICKVVRFYTIDMAGNISEKDFCINGPWIMINGEGIARSNNIIDMIAEPEDENTDGLIEAGGNFINFFTSSRDWRVTNSTAPANYDYDNFFSLVSPVSTTTEILSTSGVYLINGNITLSNSTMPNTYDDETFNQIYFINGNLTIEANVNIDDSSTALYVVKGDVRVAKSVDEVQIAIVADGDFYTAYDISEGQTTKTLELNGIYVADKFYFQRTLQGTNNAVLPSESFTYEPKYVTQMREYLGENDVIWLPYE